MSEGQRRALVLVLLGLVISAIVVGVILRERRLARPSAPASHELLTHGAILKLDPDTSVLTLRDSARTWQRDLALSVIIDGHAGPLAFGPRPPSIAGATLEAAVTLEIDAAPVNATLSLSVEPDADVAGLLLTVPALVGNAAHTLALRAEIATGGRTAFLSGVGPIADLGSTSGRLLLVDAEKLTVGFVSRGGPLDVSAVVDEADEVGSPLRLAVTGPAGPWGHAGGAAADLRLAIGPSARVIGALYRLIGEHTLRVHGEVSGSFETARVYGLDAAGSPVVRLDAEANGHFAVSVPSTVAQWYATLGSSLTSTPVRFVPGTAGELRLDVAPGGTLRVRVTDPDTKTPLTARLIVRGEGSTLDPSFGPDYRATGAGPLIDALRGEVLTPVPAGHYRVSATKGIEWSVDGQSVVVEPGHTVTVDLAPRHVIPSDGVIDCDLHVHARPSFDAPVSPEDRVLSLVAAGIDFAVPTEHNTVGDYAPVLATLDLTRELSTVTGVEVTTYSPRFGHFGVFPYPKGPVPPYRATTAAQVFAAAHRDPARILQVNHPRLGKGIGYFDVLRFDPKAAHPPPNLRTDFDTLEVYNGFDANEPIRVDAVLRDWFSLLNQGYRYVATGSSDSHRIQYQWAGYPRTLVAVPVTAAVDEAHGVDPLAVIAALKKGHASVTSGPVIDLDVDGMHAGDEVPAIDGRVRAHVTVRAAPWIDVTSLDIVVAGRVVQTIPIPSRGAVTGPELGTLAEAQLRTLRLEATLNVDVGVGDTWMLIVARGTRKLDDVIPFMPITPLAFTNPIWLLRDPASFFGPPRPKNAQR